MMKRKGFTLIELLIVVAIIAILAAIAIPNFLAAQVRAKVARAKGEMRSIATGLESYYVDYNAYPRAWVPTGFISKCSIRMIPLTTPVAFLTNIPKPDPFGLPQIQSDEYDTYDYLDEQSFIELRNSQGANPKAQWGGHTWGRAWRLCSPGPDRVQTYAMAMPIAGGGTPWSFVEWTNDNTPTAYPNIYDPTNGTVSNGDILRLGSEGKLGYGSAIVWLPND